MEDPASESEAPEEPEEVGPLVISDAHENFTMDKKYEDDPTLGLPNNKHLLCQLCDVVIVPEMYALKVKNEVDLIKNSLREYDICDTYWHLDSLDKFQNVEIHQLDEHLKYLCCLSCNCCILGYQIKAVSLNLSSLLETTSNHRELCLSLRIPPKYLSPRTESS